MLQCLAFHQKHCTEIWNQKIFSKIQQISSLYRLELCKDAFTMSDNVKIFCEMLGCLAKWSENSAMTTWTLVVTPSVRSLWHTHELLPFYYWGVTDAHNALHMMPGMRCKVSSAMEELLGKDRQRGLGTTETFLKNSESSFFIKKDSTTINPSRLDQMMSGRLTVFTRKPRFTACVSFSVRFASALTAGDVFHGLSPPPS